MERLHEKQIRGRASDGQDLFVDFNTHLVMLRTKVRQQEFYLIPPFLKNCVAVSMGYNMYNCAYITELSCCIFYLGSICSIPMLYILISDNLHLTMYTVICIFSLMSIQVVPPFIYLPQSFSLQLLGSTCQLSGLSHHVFCVQTKFLTAFLTWELIGLHKFHSNITLP